MQDTSENAQSKGMWVLLALFFMAVLVLGIAYLGWRNNWFVIEVRYPRPRYRTERKRPPPFMWAVHEGDIAAVRWHISQGIDVNKLPEDYDWGMLPLTTAVYTD